MNMNSQDASIDDQQTGLGKSSALHNDFLLDLNDFPAFNGMPSSLMSNSMNTMLSSTMAPSPTTASHPSGTLMDADTEAMLSMSANVARLSELRKLGDLIERPRSAPVPNATTLSSGSSSSTSTPKSHALSGLRQSTTAGNSPLLSMASLSMGSLGMGSSPMLSTTSSMASLSPNSPAMAMALTPAQKSALVDVQNAQAASVEQQLMSQGIDTSDMSMDELRSLANQMQNISASTAAELRRHMHIQCEQKRRAQIKDGFEELKALLPGVTNKKVSKAVVLSRTLDFVRTLKGERELIAAEMSHLRAENAQLKAMLQQMQHQ
jgi:hypothetical protein